MIGVVDATVEVTAGTVGTQNFAGQSVTMPSGASYDNVKFSWYHYDHQRRQLPAARARALNRAHVRARAHSHSRTTQKKSGR